MIVVTGANGQLGRLVIDALLKTHAPEKIVAAVRSPEKAADLAARGIVVRRADYDDPASLDTALKGATRLLLISSSEVGKRVLQHQTVIDAAQRAGIELIGYTSLLHADTSVLGLAREHRATEDALRAASTPAVILRNGWYTENHTASLGNVLAHGAILGSAGDGRFSSAARADYAQAAAAVMMRAEQGGRIYELAGNPGFTLSELAAEVSRQTGRPIVYKDMPEADYRTALQSAGLPEFLVEILANSDAGASKGALFDDSQQLSDLLGRPTTPLAVSVAAALEQAR